MEDPKLLTLLDEVISSEEIKFLTTSCNLVERISTNLSESENSKGQDANQDQLVEYLLKRILEGSTSDETKVQDRFLSIFKTLVSNKALQRYFGSKQALKAIHQHCAVSNAIKKSEKRSFWLSHTVNLLNLYLSSTSISFSDIQSQLQALTNDLAPTSQPFAGYLHALCYCQPTQMMIEKIKEVVEDIAGKKISMDSYKQASLCLSLQSICKKWKVNIDAAKFQNLENMCVGAVSAKGISRYFDEIVVDDSVNYSLQVGFFDAVCLNISLRNSEKSIIKLFRFFKACLENIQKDKLQRQKRAFQLVCFFRTFISSADSQILLSMNIDGVLEKRRVNAREELEESASISDIFVELVDFWQRQYTNKNPESRQAFLSFDHALSEKIRSEKDSSVQQALVIFFLKITKHLPSNSLRGSDLKFMTTALSILYKDESIFSLYFDLLVQHLQKVQKVNEINFYLNELEHLGQVSLSAKAHKEGQSEEETKFRMKVVEFMINAFSHCSDSKEFSSYLIGDKIELDWSEGSQSFKKFRTKVFERILNLVFKRSDAQLLELASKKYYKVVLSQLEESSETFSDLLKSAKQVGKKKTQLSQLLYGLMFQNKFEDDVEKNSDIINDVKQSCRQMIEKESDSSNVKKNKTEDDAQLPEDVFVDSMIALCSTSYSQLKHVVSNAFEENCEAISKIGFSLLFQAVIRLDFKYIRNEEEEEDDDDVDIEGEEEMDEESMGEEDDEEPVEVKKPRKTSKDSTEHLGKRRLMNGVANTNDQKSSRKASQEHSHNGTTKSKKLKS